MSKHSGSVASRHREPRFRRALVGQILAALRKDRPFLHMITGPRQTGKTTAAHQVAAEWPGEVHFAAADLPLPPEPEWVRSQWEVAAARARGGRKVLLVLDEIQKVPRWSETVKALWDREKREARGVRVLVLGSSALLLQRGLSESLTGRFLSYRCPHWSWGEMRAAFGWDLEDWLVFGGYPGAAVLKDDRETWARYITDSLVETVLGRDVLQMSSVSKPALLRHLFALAVSYPAQILSYNKMLGQLQDAGNTVTLAHYLKLLESSFLVSGVESYRAEGRKRGSSPKLVVWNNGLVSAMTRAEVGTLAPDWRGRLVENAVGSHILNSTSGLRYTLYYWRKGDLEVDYILRSPSGVWAIEVKSGRARSTRGMQAFLRSYPRARPFVVGEGGLPLEVFLGEDAGGFFR